ncbi:uncharacterized protein LOC134454802 [Engraulis encrasicolus]|uniref:uncharacterized protein LOC134454802 n=1 Tax=Engraulis encrasicolus TaxID=184585 RepID=UPI002FD25F47
MYNCIYRPTVLAEITKYIQREYQPPGQTASGQKIQFAAAINVPSTFCERFQNNFLSGESDSNTVKEKLRTEYLYQGQKLIVATPQNIGKGSGAVHSERKLLICDDNNRGGTPMKNLLARDKDGCAVFYTHNSPCLEFCLNQVKDDNEVNKERIKKQRNEKKDPDNQRDVARAVQKCILNSLDMMANHKGMKAFVFSEVYDLDLTERVKLETALTKVAKKVPLFKCNGDSCVQCLIGNVFNNLCLP